MARITNIGMPRKQFVASAAEEKEAAPQEPADAGPSAPKKDAKRKGWGRDPEIAKRARSAGDRSEDRRLRRADERQNSTTCFACRGVGHSARDCPNILLAASGQAGSAALLEAGEMAKRQAEATEEGAGAGVQSGKRGKKAKGGDIVGGKCYRCNSAQHSLSRCPKRADPQDPTPFATCFVCLGTGHLSGACPQNPRGVYVNGGACKVCGSVAHRANDCPDDKRGPKFEPERERGTMRGALVLGTGSGAGADEDDFMVERRQQHKEQRKEKKGARGKHEPAKNGARGPAKRPGDEGAYDPAAPVAAVVPAPVAAPKKKKVVSF